jgi:DNA-binding NtrC family response regulator
MGGSMPTKFNLRVLLVDDDASICATMGLLLKQFGCDVTTASSVAGAVIQMKTERFELILTDYKMEGQTGLDLVTLVKKVSPEIIIVVMTAFASLENAVQVIRAGAFDYLSKPFTAIELEQVLLKVNQMVAVVRENEVLRHSKIRTDFFSEFTSPSIRKLEEFLRKVAPTEGTVLISGESGTGKSELAHLIHEFSPRAQAPFVTVYCTTITESLLESELFGHIKGSFTGATRDKTGKLELAHGGTLFLDEIGELTLSGQTKLLRFLQEKVFERVGSNKEIRVETRIIAATNKNLLECISSGKFRDDLYYRLNSLECVVPPLRTRLEDMTVIINQMLNEILSKRCMNKPFIIPANIMNIFTTYSWPGNIRELKNVLERLVTLSMGRQPSLDDLPLGLLKPLSEATEGLSFDGTLEELEKQHIQKVVAREKNMEKAAKLLGITSVTLWRKRKQYGLSPN